MQRSTTGTGRAPRLGRAVHHAQHAHCQCCHTTLSCCLLCQAATVQQLPADIAGCSLGSDWHCPRLLDCRNIPKKASWHEQAQTHHASGHRMSGRLQLRLHCGHSKTASKAPRADKGAQALSAQVPDLHSSNLLMSNMTGSTLTHPLLTGTAASCSKQMCGWPMSLQLAHKNSQCLDVTANQ